MAAGYIEESAFGARHAANCRRPRRAL
jgi:hypothetical protein